MAHKPTPKLKRLAAGFLLRMVAEPCIRFPGRRGCLDYPQPCWPCRARQFLWRGGTK